MRDLGAFQGVRPNQLTGYGVVVGLQGTGDDNLAYLTQAMKGVSGRFGLTLPPGVNPGLKNAAAVIITAELPAFAKPGQRIDITVSTMGKAKSLARRGVDPGPAVGADGQVYAMAQGIAGRRRAGRFRPRRVQAVASTCRPSGASPMAQPWNAPWRPVSTARGHCSSTFTIRTS